MLIFELENVSLGLNDAGEQTINRWPKFIVKGAGKIYRYIRLAGFPLSKRVSCRHASVCGDVKLGHTDSLQPDLNLLSRVF